MQVTFSSVLKNQYCSSILVSGFTHHCIAPPTIISIMKQLFLYTVVTNVFSGIYNQITEVEARHKQLALYLIGIVSFRYIDGFSQFSHMEILTVLHCMCTKNYAHNFENVKIMYQQQDSRLLNAEHNCCTLFSLKQKF